MEIVATIAEAVETLKEAQPVAPEVSVVAPVASEPIPTPTKATEKPKREIWFSYCFELGLTGKAPELSTNTYWVENWSKFFSYQPKSISLLKVESKEMLLVLVKFKSVAAPKKNMDTFKQVFASVNVKPMKRKGATFESMGYGVEKL